MTDTNELIERLEIATVTLAGVGSGVYTNDIGEAIQGLREQQERIGVLEGGLSTAIAAIESIDSDLLGYGQAADGQGDVYHWPLKDELLGNLKALVGGEG